MSELLHPYRLDGSDDDLVGGIRLGFETSSLILVENLKGAMNGRLSSYEYTNLLGQIGRVWSTNDELAAEKRHQLPYYPEIITLAHNGLLGSGSLPLHSDGSHHPSRPWPGRALLPVRLPDDDSAKTQFFQLNAHIGIKWIADFLGEEVNPRRVFCYHRPAYGTGWAGRWNRLIELHPRTGVEFTAFDEPFIHRIRYADWRTDEQVELGPDDLHRFKTGLAESIRENAPQYEHTWKSDHLLIWDNRGLVHSRTKMTPGQTRELWRITFDFTW